MRGWTDFTIIKRRSDQIRYALLSVLKRWQKFFFWQSPQTHSCSPHQDTMTWRRKYNTTTKKNPKTKQQIIYSSFIVDFTEINSGLRKILFISDRVKRGESLCQIFLCYFFGVDIFVSCHAETTPAGDLQEFVAPPQLRDAACPPCASCTLTFSPNLLAALPHFITPPCGLSLIITYWFFIAVTTARVVYEASFEWEAEAERHGNRRTPPLIRTRSDESIGFDRRLAKRNKNCPQAQAAFPSTRVNALERRPPQDHT